MGVDRTRTVGPRALGLWLALGLALGGCAKSEARWADELQAEDPFVRALAALALSELAPRRGPQLAPVLLATVDRVELDLGPQVADALERVAPHACEELVRALLEDEFMTLDRREAALAALASTGEQALQTAVAAVRGSGLERTGVLEAVLLRAGAAAVPTLVALVSSDPDARVRVFAAHGLGTLGAPARAALPALRAAAERAGPQERALLEAACARIEDAPRSEAP